MLIEKVNYLPLGSIVVIKGGVKKYMIAARGLGVNIGEKSAYFDYGACMYPEGMMGDKMMYFQHEDITKTVFEGFSDEDDRLMVDNINEALAKTDMEKADVKKLQEE
ncbi:DUF4176 domain-containing protein [Hominimerdicola sp. 21CYCFAH17_S]